jgi:hypothetical protein
MVKLMRGASKMSNQMISEDLHSATSSPESVYGVTLYGELDGRTTDLSGQVPALASLSPSQAHKPGLTTSGTFGRTG